MSGKRMLHANICESKKLSEISFAAETLYYRLITRVDDDGNFSADPRIVLGQCVPLRRELDEKKVLVLLEELASVTSGEKKPLIQFYTKDGDKCLHVTRFEDFQYLRPDRTATAKFPTHPPRMGPSLVNQRYTNGLPNGNQMATAAVLKLNEVKLNETNDKCDFANLRRAYRDVIQKPCSNSKEHSRLYAKFCGEYGEPDVLAACSLWAEDNKWRDKKPELYFFYQEISRWIEAVRDDQKDFTVAEVISDEEQQKIIAADHAQAAIVNAKWTAKIQQDEKDSEEQKANPLAF